MSEISVIGHSNDVSQCSLGKKYDTLEGTAVPMARITRQVPYLI
jgi:hypothetical protein